jgi:hypothetical protein
VDKKLSGGISKACAVGLEVKEQNQIAWSVSDILIFYFCILTFTLMKKLILLNIAFFVILMLLYMLTAFTLGYVAGAKYGTDTAILYLLVVLVQLFLNYRLMHKNAAFTTRHRWYASTIIICMYALLVFH